MKKILIAVVGILVVATAFAQPETPNDQLIQEFFLAATGLSHVETQPLLSGREYFLKVTGDYQVSADWGLCLDAAFYCSDSSTALSDTALSAVVWLWDNVRHPRPTPDIYSPEHVYYFPFTGSGQPETFDFFDDWYADNARGLSSQVWLRGCDPTPLPFIDYFNSPELDSCWFWIREDNTHWSLTERPGWMRKWTKFHSNQEAEPHNQLK